ncbi:hypothetical protein [Alcanivorax sp.]|jgi:hypothetical protein|uniref:hypothetical protein n=1 Tax=Alcanivorax sp. TaxID=1872427 RepID=UPI0032D9ACCB
MTKRYIILAFVGFLFVPVGSMAQSADWGDVAGGSDSGMVSEMPKGGANESPWGQTDVQPEVSAKPKQASKDLACGEDDPRYSQLMTVLRTVKEGGDVDPLQTSFSTYVEMNKKVRDMLGSTIFISSPDCSKQFVFDGELTGKVVLPFPELWNLITNALRVGDKEQIDFILAGTTAAPEPANNLISMVQYAPLDGQQLRRLKSIMGYGENGSKEQGESKEKEGVIMLDVYLQLGGMVEYADRGKSVVFVVNNMRELELEKIYLDKVEENKGVGVVIGGGEVVKKISSLLASLGLKPSTISDYDARKRIKANK